MDEESVYSAQSFHSRPGSERHNDAKKSVSSPQSPATRPLLTTEESGREEEEDGRDDNWGETTTAVTSERSASLEDVSVRRGPVEAQSGGPGARAWLGFYAFCTLGVLTLLTPPLFILLPQVLWRGELQPCGVFCEGLYISVAFKTLIMVVGCWAVFLRAPRYALPRLVEFRALVLLLLAVFLLSYWLFYVVRVLGAREQNLQSVVQYASSMVDTFIFIHYLALVLLELRQLQPYYILRVVRSSDGHTHHYTMGTLSIQRAALSVLEKYYADFPAVTPEWQSRRHSEGKRLRLDGKESSASQSQLSYKDRYYEDNEYKRKLRRRRARLVVAVQRAFAQVDLLDNSMKSAHALSPREAAQNVFPLIAQSLQRFLRSTRQNHLYNMEAIITHLTHCLTHALSAQAFLEHYLRPGPVFQYSGTAAEWTLVSEESVTGSLHSGLTFCLRGADTRLVVAVSEIPRLTLSESFIPTSSHQFVVSLYPPTMVDSSTISPA